MSFYSKSFYQESYNRGIKKSFINFLLFFGVTFLLSIIGSFIALGYYYLSLLIYIKEIPVFTIDNGKIEIDMEMPYEYTEFNGYIGVDTTGVLEEFPDNASEGILVLEDGIIYNSSGDKGFLEFSELEEMMNEFGYSSPIEFDSELLTDLWNKAFIIIFIGTPIYVLFAKIIEFLFIIGFTTLVAGITFMILNKRFALRKAFIISLYIVIPITIISFILTLFESGLFLINLGIISETLKSTIVIPLFFKFTVWVVFLTVGMYSIKDK